MLHSAPFPPKHSPDAAAPSAAAQFARVGALEGADELPGQPASEAVSAAVEGHGTATAHEAKLPQLRPQGYPSQVFWLAVVFIGLYVLLQRALLPRIHHVLDNRANRIQQDLDRAEHAQQQAAASRDTYEKTQGEARAHTQNLMDAVQARVKEVTDRSQAEMDATLKAQMQESDARIAQALAGAMARTDAPAGDLAASIVEKIVHVRPSDEQVQSALRSALARAAATRRAS